MILINTFRLKYYKIEEKDIKTMQNRVSSVVA